MNMALIKKAIFLCVIISMLIGIQGCRKTFDINQDPNNPSLDIGTPKLVFPVAVMGVAAVEGGDLALLGGILGEYVTQAALSNQYKNIDRYDLKSTDMNDQYTTLYSYGLKNLQFVIDKSAEAEDWNFYLMGTVMKAYATTLLVDLYDNIPYTEALQGVKNLTPKFDDGYTIYKSLLADIETALSKDFSARTAVDLKATGEGGIDLVFGGDIGKWKQFANTLELKMYLRMTNAKPAEAQSGVESLKDREFLNVDAKVTGFIDAESESNPLYEQNIRQLNTPDNIRASNTYLLFLKANDDPRIPHFFNPVAGTSTFAGLDQGDFSNSDPAARETSIFLQTPEDPVVFLSAAESYFLQAEASVRYPAFGGDAKTLFDYGVKAAFSSVGESGDLFIEPGGAYEYPNGTIEENIEAIIVQKWASFPYGVHFIEGWFERNRTGFPKNSPVYSSDPAYVPGEFVISNNSVLGPGQYPKRMVYPDEERKTNPNTPAEVAITTPVWWGL
jgi:hypothetical protein